jgi:hypothetical protein
VFDPDLGFCDSTGFWVGCLLWAVKGGLCELRLLGCSWLSGVIFVCDGIDWQCRK